MTDPNNDSLTQSCRVGLLLLAGLVCALWTGGCASSNPPSGFARGQVADMLPKLALVATGPLAAVLTNADAFSADFTLTITAGGGAPTKLSGRLLTGGGKLRLAADFSPSHRRLAADECDVIWNGATGQGYVVSEALQGYAPLAGGVHFSNVLTQVVTGGPDRLEDHPLDQANVTLLGENDQMFRLLVSRALDLDFLPVRIQSMNGPDLFTLTLSNLQRVRPGSGDFLVPYGFTKFAGAGALIDELVIRQQNFFGGSSGEPGEQPAGTPAAHYGNASQVP